MVSQEQVTAGGTEWRAHQGKRATVYALPGSYAATRATATLQEAEQIVEALVKLLPPAAEPRDDRITIYLTDPLDVSRHAAPAESPLDGDPAPSEGAVVRTVRPDAPAEPLARPITRLLVRRWFGEQAAQADVVLEGIAGVVAARSGAGPSVQDVNQWARGELAARRPLAIVGRSAPTGQASTEDPALSRAATSFVAFLLDTAGGGAVQRFLAQYDPARRDQAAVAAFQQPLGALEEGWLNTLRQRKGQGAFRVFFRQIGPLLKPYWRRELEVLALMILGLTYGLVLPLSGKYLVDTIIPSGDIAHLIIFILILAVIYVVNLLVGMRRAYVNNWINQHVLIDMQERMFARLQRQSHSFFAEVKVGDLMARFANDVAMVQQAMGQVVGVGVYLALSAIAASITLLILNPLLGVLVLIVVPIFALTYATLGKRLERASFERQKRTGEAMAALQENLSAYPVVRAFSMEERVKAAYHALLLALLRAMLRLVVFGALFETSTALATTLGQLVVLGVGGTLVIKGYLTVGTLIAFIGLLPALFTPVASLSSVGQVVQSAAGSLNRMEEVMNAPIAVEDASGAAALPPLQDAIKLDDVTFGYGGERAVLRDFTLALPAGMHVAIVGPSGSGKSTIVNLLLRFWDPEAGRVLFDNHDARTVTLASLRGQIGVVFQDTFIFNTTVRENIALSRPTASDAEVVAAARAAQLDEYITSLPAGYDTILGERGVKMSGGQRQRLAIARALLRDPRILILDEATSALDAATEREILETLEQVARGRTTISITHRLSLAAMADRVVVLDRGQVVEEGTHEQLAQAGGLYQRLYEEQTGQLVGAGRRTRVEPERLRSVPLLARLDAGALARLASRVVVEHFAADMDVVQQGDPGDTLYIIAKGAVEVLARDGERRRQVNTLTEGDYFGEMALLADEPRIATVRTTIPTDLYSLARADFLALLEREPDLRASIAATMAARRTALVAALAPREAAAAT